MFLTRPVQVLFRQMLERPPKEGGCLVPQSHLYDDFPKVS